MWGGRYKLGPAEIMEKINASIDTDRRPSTALAMRRAANGLRMMLP